MSLSSAPTISDLDELKQKFKDADKDKNGVLNRNGLKDLKDILYIM